MKSSEWAWLFGVTTWRIWHSQFVKIFYGKQVNIQFLVREIEIFSNLFRDAWSAHKKLSNVGPRREQILLDWNWQPSGWCKVLNSDRVIRKALKRGGAGGILCDEMGQWQQGGFMAHWGISSLTMAEFWGKYLGLELAWDKVQRHINAEVDNEVIVSHKRYLV